MDDNQWNAGAPRPCQLGERFNFSGLMYAYIVLFAIGCAAYWIPHLW